ncbi:MAG TPA: response regulator [Usitatibacter sp.]|nr:response regulator [Usitatibacter sp.]
MIRRWRVLVVDDNPQNVKLLAQLLRGEYEVVTANSGAEALDQLVSQSPDLVLLDVVMPSMSGYEVCREIRARPGMALLPVVMVTALDPAAERVKGIEAGADDFLTKPINAQEVLARVRSLLRIRALHQEVEEQTRRLAEWNAKLEQRVQEQVGEIERMGRLKRFLSPRVAELIVAGELDDPMATRRKEVTIVFTDLRGFTAFSETAAPEDVLSALRQYHGEIGRLVGKYDGTVEHFAGDGVMLIFNDPAPLPDPAMSAVRTALELRYAFGALQEGWRRLGYELGLGIGIAQGFATIGTIGFPGRWDYGTVGAVNNLAARLCAHAKPGEVLVSKRVMGRLEGRVDAESVRELELKGINGPVSAYNVLALCREERVAPGARP